jgi:hypothetical protein
LIGLDDQSIIIFGGIYSIADENSLYVLSISSLTWSIPKVSGKTPSTRNYHTANVIGKYMVIAFGKYDIYILLSPNF